MSLESKSKEFILKWMSKRYRVFHPDESYIDSVMVFNTKLHIDLSKNMSIISTKGNLYWQIDHLFSDLLHVMKLIKLDLKSILGLDDKDSKIIVIEFIGSILKEHEITEYLLLFDETLKNTCNYWGFDSDIVDILNIKIKFQDETEYFDWLESLSSPSE